MLHGRESFSFPASKNIAVEHAAARRENFGFAAGLSIIGDPVAATQVKLSKE
uniref:hypothetical protein n=1 Tax=Burkholderia anthina TaxID=179879 RepID=UPI00158D1139|nr:hypothetical protein [Burkholderia anthina]